MTSREKAIKREGERGHGAAANAWRDHGAGSKHQSGSNLRNGGKGEVAL